MRTGTVASIRPGTWRKPRRRRRTRCDDRPLESRAMASTFLWYDLETWGRDPRTSRIAQFAAQRTDLELNPVGAPVSLLCRAADDLLPSPEASLVTGLTPQDTERDGLVEAAFFARICEQLSQPGTCA